jgi:hypothetical protein
MKQVRIFVWVSIISILAFSLRQVNAQIAFQLNSEGMTNAGPIRAPSSASLSDSVPFSLNPTGGAVFIPTVPSTLSVGYVTVQPTASSSIPAMMEVLGFQPSGITTTETVLPTAPLTTSGRLWVHFSGPVSTGAAFANPNNQSVVVSYYFTDQSGNDSATGNFILGPGTQGSYLFNQAPFSGSPSVGTFTFSASAPLSVLGLRFLVNERSEYVFTPLPAVPLPSGLAGNAIIPLWADGGGFSDLVVLTNPTSAAISGSVQFLLPSGSPATLTVNGVSGTSFPYAIPAKSVVELLTSNGAGVQFGSVAITPALGASTPSAFALSISKPSTITVTEAVIPASSSSLASRVYVENSNNVLGGILVANPSPSQANANFSLTSLSGSVLGTASNVPIPGNGQLAKFVTDLFPGLPGSVQGILRVFTSSVAGLVTEGIRYRINERGDYLIAGVPAFPENVSGDTVLPHLVAGGGFYPQIVLFSRSSAGPVAGTIKAVSQTGGPLLIFDLSKLLKRVRGQITSQ